MKNFVKLILIAGAIMGTSAFAQKQSKVPAKPRLYFRSLDGRKNDSSMYLAWTVSRIPGESNWLGYLTGVDFPESERKWEERVIKQEAKAVKKKLIGLIRDIAFVRPNGYENEILALNTMVEDGLIEDIEKSKYEFKRECLDENGVSKEAVARMGMKGDTICFNVRKIRAHDQKFELYLIIHHLIALALHEHVHHFGYLDATHRFYALMMGSMLIYRAQGLEGIQSFETTTELVQDYNRFAAQPVMLDASSFKTKKALQCRLETVKDGQPVMLTASVSEDSFLQDRFTFTLEGYKPMTLQLDGSGLWGKNDQDQYIEIKAQADGQLRFEMSKPDPSIDYSYREDVLPALRQHIRGQAAYSVAYGSCS